MIRADDLDPADQHANVTLHHLLHPQPHFDRLHVYGVCCLNLKVFHVHLLPAWLREFQLDVLLLEQSRFLSRIPVPS